MHETFFVNQIIEEANKKGKVKGIVVEVGDLAHIPAEDLERALKDRVNWDIKIKKKKATVVCGCGYKGEPKIIERKHDLLLFSCPNCDAIPKILDGEDIILRQVILK